ncbi:uncharacterized protein LOC110849030 isoform X2 [Folsomia candida]|uniref:uncharacterized protein LOC110849030 isoform X2 n=1 Tax=Folsomia candida TaxID=158441 RepID=UPI001604BBDE|nr:uncharacterized protein LOC110849030 isoform X2 [Folsomia candida]
MNGNKISETTGRPIKCSVRDLWPPVCEEIDKLTHPQLTKYVSKLTSLTILTPEEGSVISHSSDKAKFFEFINSRGINQVIKTLNILKDDPVNQGIRDKLYGLSEKHNLQEEFPNLPPPRNSRISEISVQIEEGPLLQQSQEPIPEQTIGARTLTCIKQKRLKMVTVASSVGFVLLLFTQLYIPSTAIDRTSDQNNSPPNNRENVDTYPTLSAILPLDNPAPLPPGIDESWRNVSNATRDIVPMVRDGQLHNHTEIIIPALENGRNFSNVSTSSQSSTSLSTNSLKLLDVQLTRLKNVFNLPRMQTLEIDSASDIDHMKTLICNKTVKKALEVKVRGTFDLAKFQKMHDCVKDINGLILSGNVTINVSHQILRDAPNIEFLVINAHDICRTIENGEELLDIESLEKVSLQNLRYLKVTNFLSDCSDLVQFMDEVFITRNVETVVYDNVNLRHADHTHWIENSISKHDKLESFHFSGRICPNCELFQKVVFNKSLKSKYTRLF